MADLSYISPLREIKYSLKKEKQSRDLDVELLLESFGFNKTLEEGRLTVYGHKDKRYTNIIKDGDNAKISFFGEFTDFDHFIETRTMVDVIGELSEPTLAGYVSSALQKLRQFAHSTVDAFNVYSQSLRHKVKKINEEYDGATQLQADEWNQLGAMIDSTVSSSEDYVDNQSTVELPISDPVSQAFKETVRPNRAVENLTEDREYLVNVLPEFWGVPFTEKVDTDDIPIAPDDLATIVDESPRSPL